jgi:hypothetical protein
MGHYLYNDRNRVFAKLFPIEHPSDQEINIGIRRYPTSVSKIELIATSFETETNNYIV